LILRKISKIGATRCQILRLKFTKIDFRWGSAPDPAGGAYSAPPDPLAVFKGLLLRGGRGKERERRVQGRERRREGRERERREREGREGNGNMHPLGFSKVGAYAFRGFDFAADRWELNANSSKTFKARDFKFDTRVPRDSPDTTPKNFSKRGRGQGHVTP